MSDDRDPPIIEQPFIAGVTVVDLGDYRVARGMTRREWSGCPHRSLVYDNSERRIWCKDCEKDVEPFDAFRGILESYSRAYDNLVTRGKRVAEAEVFQARTLATKALDAAWRKHHTVPACPHCGMGLFPEDFKNGIGTTLGRDYAEALAKKRKP